MNDETKQPVPELDVAMKAAEEIARSVWVWPSVIQNFTEKFAPIIRKHFPSQENSQTGKVSSAITGAREWFSDDEEWHDANYAAGCVYDGYAKGRDKGAAELCSIMDSYASSLRAEIERLTKERDEAQAKNKRSICGYCGTISENDGTPAGLISVALAHAEVCEKSPLKQLIDAQSTLSTYKGLVGELAKIPQDGTVTITTLNSVDDLIRRAKELEAKQ